MRLVRDDDLMEMEEPKPLRPRQAPVEPQDAEEPDGQVEVDDEAAQGPEDSSQPDAAVDLRSLEALLMSTHHPLTAGRLAELLNLPASRPIKRAVAQLNEQYADTNRSFRIEQVAGGYQILTLPEFGSVVKLLHQKELDAKWAGNADRSRPNRKILCSEAYEQLLLFSRNSSHRYLFGCTEQRH